MAEQTILVVDDEAPIRTLLKNVLGRAKYKVLEAADGQQALEVCAREASSIDLLLTDIVMPGMDGIRLANEIFSICPRMKILYMSGKCDFETVENHVREYGFGFIRKPFAITSLVHAVEEVLAGPAHRPKPAGEKGSKSASASGSPPK